MSRDIAALIALIELRSGRAFRWRRGRDCVSFAAACVKAQTGQDILADVPAWKSRREARAVADTQGGIIWALDQKLRPVAPALALRGDIAGVPDALFGIRLMIIEGDTLVGPGESGLERQPRSMMTMAWSVTAEVPHG